MTKKRGPDVVPRTGAQKLRLDLVGAASTLLLHSLAARALVAPPFSYAIPSTPIHSLNDVSSFIQRYCTEALSASKKTGRLLYRGGPSTRSLDALIVSEQPDLLDPATYGSSVAVEYFATIESYLKSQSSQEATIVLPSNGHLASPNVMEVRIAILKFLSSSRRLCLPSRLSFRQVNGEKHTLVGLLTR